MPTAPTLAAAPPEAAQHLETHRAAIWRYVRALGAGTTEADDLVQETMLVACAGPLPAEPAAARAFLRGVARNHWLRSRRWWQRRREREVAAAVDELWLATAEHDGGEDLLTRMRSCLDRLQARTRHALELHYRDGFAWSEVGAQVGLAPDGIKTLAQRARQALRECIERRNP